MTGICRIACVLVACILANVEGVSAQDRPVAFLHGFASSGATWQEAADTLQQQLALEAHRPNTSSQNQIEVQAAQVQSALGPLSPFSVAVAHSNGGLVGRQWSRTQPLGGLVTIGTPHGGLPGIANFERWVDFNDEVYFRLTGIFEAFSQCLSFESCNWADYSQILYGQGLNNLMVILGDFFTSNAYQVASTLGFVVFDQVVTDTDVLFQVSTGSSFLTGLNGTVGSELTLNRVGIVNVAYNYDKAGFWRLVAPESADTGWLLLGTAAILMDAGAAYIYSTADPANGIAMFVADSLSFGANILYNADWYWCRIITSPTFADECYENDTLVPNWSQALPNGVPLDHFGPAHIRETTQSNAKLYEALTNFMAIPPRTGGGGNPMQANSAVRGCSNWTWLNPVFMPDANACYSYCQQNGASACEWASQADGASSAGDCYAEFGSGCYVESGHSPWFAAVLSSTPPPPPPGQMQANSAVRGCANWIWWDPVTMPSAAACAEYCVNNGANACEWASQADGASNAGDCYVEFGSGCYVEAGYSGWYALVLP